MDIIEAAEQRKLGMEKEEFIKEVTEKTEDRFNQIFKLVFGWTPQPDGSQKLMSRLPNGKVVFIDRRDDIKNIKEGKPYICLVYEREKEAFARVICEVYQPNIFVQSNGIVSLVYRKNTDEIVRKIIVANTLEERLVEALKICMQLQVSSVEVIFRAFENKGERRKV